MAKPANVILQFDKSAGYWSAFVTDADGAIVREIGNLIVASFPVKNYTLEDHQFVQLALNRKNGREFVILIPRNIVVTVIEGKRGLGEDSYFAGGTTK